MGSETQKVVIIDDEPTTLLLLESAVESLAKTVTVSQSVQAFECVKLHRPDLVVLDISMPEVSGFEVCKQLKACPVTASIPVFFCDRYGYRATGARYCYCNRALSVKPRIKDCG